MKTTLLICRIVAAIVTSSLMLFFSACGNVEEIVGPKFDSDNPYMGVAPVADFVTNPTFFDGKIASFQSTVTEDDLKNCCLKQDRVNAESFAVLIISAWIEGEHEKGMSTQEFMNLVASSDMAEDNWQFFAREYWTGKAKVGGILVPGVNGYLQSTINGTNKQVKSMTSDIVFPVKDPFSLGEPQMLWATYQVELQWSNRWTVKRVAYGMNRESSFTPISSPELPQDVRERMMPGDAWRIVPGVSE